MGAAGSHWADLARSLAVDVSFLQEAEQPDGPAFSLWTPVPGRPWGSAVVVRQGDLQPIDVPDFEGWVVGGRWSYPTALGSDHLYVFSVHAPTGRGPYDKETLAILDRLRDVVPPGSEMLIGGDFNLKSFGERALGEALATTRAERQVLDLVADMGLVSCWPAAHPGEPLAQTLHWTGDRTRPFQCDAILIPKEWAEGIRSEVITGPGLEAASDHLPVIADVLGRVGAGRAPISTKRVIRE